MTRKPIISGVYDTKVGKLPGSSVMSLHSEAALGAVADAGLELSDIDGVLCGYALTEPHMMMSSVLCEYLGIHPGYSAALQIGGATGCIMLMQAASLVEGGYCRHVLIMAGENRLTGFAQGGAVAALAAFGHPQFEVPYGVTVPACYALVAQNYMHECGATLDHLGAIAVSARRHASMNPKAHMRKPITLEDVSASRIISSPLRLFDCCLISDGAAAVVVSAGEAAGDIKKRPLEILGTGQGHTHEHIFAAPSLTEFGCKQAARTAFARAGLKPADIDVAEIYDSFTITLLIELESMGFFERGEAGPAALEGRLGFDGSLPCNTHGGLLSYGHAGVAGGMFHIVEAARQLRGEGGACQVKDPEVAFVHGDGGILSAHCSVILGRG